METLLCPECHHSEIVPDYLPQVLGDVRCPHCGSKMVEDNG